LICSILTEKEKKKKIIIGSSAVFTFLTQVKVTYRERRSWKIKERIVKVFSYNRVYALLFIREAT